MPTGGSMTRAQFKKAQLDHLIDVILNANGDTDNEYRCIADMCPTDNVQDYINIDCGELDAMNLTKAGTSNNPVDLSNAMKKCVLALKSFWAHWGDNTTKDWCTLSIGDFETFLLTGTGPPINIPPTSAAPPPTTQADNIAAITNAISAAILTKPLLATLTFL